MSLQVSTGWKALTVALAKASFDGGVIRLFSGTQPATSDLAQTGALLGEIRIDGGAPLEFDASGPYLVKPVMANWVFTASASGMLGWFRLVTSPGDAGLVSYSLPRFDGAVGLAGAGAELTVASLAVTSGETYPIDAFFYSIPPLGA